MAVKTVSILGSTGSIGCNTVDLIARDPEAYRVIALTANRSVEKLAEQARLLKPEIVAVADETQKSALQDALEGTGIEILTGEAGVTEAAARPADWTMSAIVGAAGLIPTMAAIKNGGTLALANKETLVCGGQLVLDAVRDCGATLIPVDSEHSAIFQVFETEQKDHIEKIILTASGGPFREKTLAEMEDMTPAQAVAHPNWSMGAKISVDSASMANKGLELIEAYHLFGLPEEQIDILVHPQSVIHSMVAYEDGSVLAQLGTPDMRTPIAYALGWPNRIKAPSPRLNFTDMKDLTFNAPDPVRFPALRLARESLKEGGAAPIIFNAANEIGVDLFLNEKIGFLDIARCTEDCLEKMTATPLKNIDDVLAVDAKAREIALSVARLKN